MLMTEERLKALGIYEKDGRYYHDRPRNRNFKFDPTDPKAELNGKLISYDQESVPWPVIVASDSDPRGIEQARKRAVEERADFYHPKHGWLRWGRKRATDSPENLGNNATVYPKQTILVRADPDPDDDEKPTPPPVEAPVEAPEPVTAGPGRRRQEG